MQDTNLKISPYFDDFDRTANYQKVLFKPGYSVQTRELNTLQSTLQNQIERFGQHVFKDGSVVIPGNVTYRLDYKAVLVQPLINGIQVESYRANLKGKTLTGSTSQVKATVLNTISATESEKDTLTLYVRYESGGILENDQQVDAFKNNEILIDEDGVAVAITTVENSTAYTGSIAYINAGVYFIRGFFVEVASQEIILDQYSNKPSYKVGLQINESIVTSEEDESLFDNAINTTNYASPGADRLKIEPKFVKQNIFITEDSNFIELLRLEEGKLTKIVNNSAYNELEKNLARRTFDESGDYTVKPYSVKIREALNNGTNGGVYNSGEILPDGRTILNQVLTSSPDNSIDGKDFYALEVSEGKAYVKGFEVNNQRKQYIVVPKPRKTNSVNNKSILLNVGSYLQLDSNETISGYVKLGDEISLKSVGSSNVIGKATAIGFTEGYRLYLTDLTIFEKFTVTSHNFSTGDFVTGITSGATAFVHATSTTEITVKQVTGNFIPNETITSSNSNSTNVTINSISKSSLENIRTVSTTNFSASVLLESVAISGSSFNVSGNNLAGVNSLFTGEINADSRIKLGEYEVEVDSVSGNTSATISNGSTAVPNGTYYSGFKLICKYYSSDSGLVVKASNNPVDKTEDFSHNRLVSEIGAYTVLNDLLTISTVSTNTIDRNSIIVTTSSGIVTGTVAQLSPSLVSISNLKDKNNNSIANGTSVNIFYNVLVSNPSLRSKTRKQFNFLEVDKENNTNNTVYGTRYSDKEISLKFPDVIKIHAIHQLISSSTNINGTAAFDRVIVNDASKVNVGDIFTQGSTRATVINKSSNTLYVKYNGSRIIRGDNLALPISFINNPNASGVFVQESIYGSYIDLTDDFTLRRNDTAEFYRISKLIRKSTAAVPDGKIYVVFDYFEHENLNNDFYTVDSYGLIPYSEIPFAYNSVSHGDLIDFRYYITPSSSTGTTGSISSPFKETSTSSPFEHSKYSSGVDTTFSASQKVPFPNGLVLLDYDFYLGRTDKVYMTIDGKAKVVRGADSIQPEQQDSNSIGLLLSTIKLPPYLSNVNDAQIIMEKNRVYTMKDIGKLETRLSGVEQYASLSLLESNTINMNILDEEGRNRFKNGFVVDSFTSTNIADLNNVDYSASIDLDKNLMRPYPYIGNVGFTYNQVQSSTLKKGSYLSIPYAEIPYITQNYASRVENVTPFLVSTWIGDIEITPKKDIWYDTVREVREGEVIDLTSPFRTLVDFIAPNGEVWGEWSTTTSRGGGGTTITSVRTGTSFDISDLSFELESGDTIQSVQDIKFTRSRLINIKASGLKPNTKFNFAINEEAANSTIYPKLLKGITKDSNVKFIIGETVRLSPIFDDNLFRVLSFSHIKATVIDPRVYTNDVTTTDFSGSEYTAGSTLLAIDQLRSDDGTDLRPVDLGAKFRIFGETSGASATSGSDLSINSNAYGDLEAFVIFPEEKYETGDITFGLSDRSDNAQILGLSGSYANSVYYSQGTSLNVSSTVTTLEVPELTTESLQQVNRVFIPDPPPPPPAPRGRDPIAQTFTVDIEGGIFITSMDLYFFSKDTIAPVKVDIRTVENGIPTQNVVPGTTSVVSSNDVLTSNDASVPTRFEFKNPVYLSDRNEYCFVVQSSSTNYYIWVSRLSEKDVSTGFIIDEQPAVGVFLKSANQSTWISDQYEDIKFVLNRAQFETNTTHTAVLYNTPVQSSKLINNPLTFTEGSSTVRVFHPNHGMHSGQNKVRFENIVSDTQNLVLNAPLSGTSTNTSFQVTDVNGDSVTLSQITGLTKIDNESVGIDNPGYLKIGDEIVSYGGYSGSQFTNVKRAQFGTVAESHNPGDVVYCYAVNGIVLDQINDVLTVSEVISLDEYEVIVENAANATKQSGGNQVKASHNIQYEIIQPKINAFTPPETTLNINFDSFTATSIDANPTLQPPFLPKVSETINNYSENPLSEPRMIMSEPNRLFYTPGVPGTLKTSLALTTTVDNLSPTIDIDSSSIITISNRINKITDQNNNLDISSELLPSGGKHSAYITKKIVLENSSTSVKVMFDAIRNPGADIKVFVKIKGDSNFGSFDDMNYEEIPSLSYPTSNTTSEYRAFDFEIKGMREFKEFSVKIIMISADQSNVPKIKNLRCLGLAI